MKKHAPKKGSYFLVMKLKEEKALPVGRKPAVKFPGGFYCYVGSAMNSLEKRICRHISTEKRKRWHIDYFLKHAKLLDVKTIESDKRLECCLNQEVERKADGTPMKGFGSSDCRECSAHLHHFREDPSGMLEELAERWKGKAKA